MIADIDLVTKPPERINKHSMEQTSQLGTLQQTETLNNTELSSEKESLRDNRDTLRKVPITFKEPKNDKEIVTKSVHINKERSEVSPNKCSPSRNQQDWSKSAKPPQGKQNV